MLLCVIFSIYCALRTWRYHFERCVADYYGEAEGKIEHATLAAVLEAGACEADIGALLSRCSIWFPLEYRKWTRANLAFYTEKLTKH
jgi:hypothetical protein